MAGGGHPARSIARAIVGALALTVGFSLLLAGTALAAGPTVSSIDIASGASPNNASTEVFYVSFSDAVTGVDASDFTLTTTGTVAGTIAPPSSPDGGYEYTVTVTSVTGDGTMRLDLDGSGTGIQDLSGNPISGGYTGGQVYAIDHTPPTVTSIQADGSSPNNSSFESFEVTFSEPVTGLDASDFTLTTTGTVAGTIEPPYRLRGRQHVHRDHDPGDR